MEAHLFNPPPVSLAMSLKTKNLGEKAGYAWSRVKSIIPYGREAQVSSDVKRPWLSNRRVGCLGYMVMV